MTQQKAQGLTLRWTDQHFLKKTMVLLFPDNIHHKKYNGSCFVYLSEILSKLHMCKVTNFVTFYDGLLKIKCNFA